ncbi:hypothetical protein ACFX11_020065 [Malus domestica]
MVPIVKNSNVSFPKEEESRCCKGGGWVERSLGEHFRWAPYLELLSEEEAAVLSLVWSAQKVERLLQGTELEPDGEALELSRDGDGLGSGGRESKLGWCHWKSQTFIIEHLNLELFVFHVVRVRDNEIKSLVPDKVG